MNDIASFVGPGFFTAPLAETDPDLMIASYFTSTKTAESDPDLVKRFTAAMNKSLEYAEAHPEEVQQILTTYTELDAKTAAALTLPKWSTTVDQHSFDVLADLSSQDGALKEKPDISAMLPSALCTTIRATPAFEGSKESTPSATVDPGGAETRRAFAGIVARTITPSPSNGPMFVIVATNVASPPTWTEAASVDIRAMTSSGNVGGGAADDPVEVRFG